MKFLLGVVSLNVAVVSYTLALRHIHLSNYGPMRVYDECARTAGLSNETMVKMKESFKASMRDMDPKKLRERYDPAKQADDMKAVVKEAEADKAEAFDSCLSAVEDRWLNRSPMIACANSTGVSAEGVAKLKQVIHNSKSEKDMKKRHKQIHDDAKKALEENDKDKAEAYEKCVNDVTAKFHSMKARHHHKGHGGPKGEEKAEGKAEPKGDEEAKPAED